MVTDFSERLKHLGFKPLKAHAMALKTRYMFTVKDFCHWAVDVSEEPDGFSAWFVYSYLGQDVYRYSGQFDRRGYPRNGDGRKILEELSNGRRFRIYTKHDIR